MGTGHALAIQLLPQLAGVGDWDGLAQAVFETSVQNLVARDGSRRGVIMAAKGKEKSDHILRVAVLPLAHVGSDPRSDGCLSGQKQSVAA